MVTAGPQPPQSRGWWETQTWQRECGQAAESSKAGGYSIEANSAHPNGEREEYRDVHGNLKKERSGTRLGSHGPLRLVNSMETVVGREGLFFTPGFELGLGVNKPRAARFHLVVLRMKLIP